ncbi:MAG TPA: glutaminyl-peptide cyclotransferase [Rhizomicrobium sp.]
MRALICSLLFASSLALPAAAATCPLPRNLTFKVEKEIRRSDVGFTEGLEAHDGALYESTGDFFGTSRINRIDPLTGKVTTLLDAGKRYFGEGMTFFGGRLYQMTWREHRVFVFDKAMHPLPELKNPREGWGLTHDASRLIASDGSSRLFFLSPETFATLGEVAVTENGRYLENLNELEYADGAVWANVFEQWRLVKIAPATGCVEAQVFLRPLYERMSVADRRYVDSDDNFVPNGIAYDAASGLFTLTGKYWPILFSGRFVDAD